MWRILIVMGVLMIPVGVFFYFYFRRTILFWSHKEEKSRGIRNASIILAVLMVIGSANTFSATALVILHVAAVQAVIQLLWLAVKRLDKPVLEKIYRCGLVPLAVTAVILGYGYFHMKDVERKDYTVAVDKELPEGVTVAMLSDLHFGTTMDVEKLQEYCDEISTQNPDIIALCGDIVDERTTKEEMQQAIQVLGSMKSRYGLYYVFGNHDPATYSFHPPFTVTELTAQFEANGIQMLTDDCVELGENIVLAGRLDRSYTMETGRKSTEELLEGVDKEKFILLLDHQPVELEENAAAGVDLQLSGHTHGGQIWPVGLISDVLGFGELNYGEKTIGSYHIIVSSGIAGWGYPIRTGSDSEYLMVEVSGK